MEMNVFAICKAACIPDTWCVQVMEESTVVMNDRKVLIPDSVHLLWFHLVNTIIDRARPLALRWPITNQMKREIPVSFKTSGHSHGDRDASSSGMNRRRRICEKTTSNRITG